MEVRLAATLSAGRAVSRITGFCGVVFLFLRHLLLLCYRYKSPILD